MVHALIVMHMPTEIQLSTGEKITLRPGLPPGADFPVLPGSRPAWAQTQSIQIIMQELKGEGYSLRLWIARILDQLNAAGKLHKEGLYGLFMLNNGVRQELKSIGKMHIREEQYAGYLTPPTNWTVRFQGQKEYQAIDLYCSPELLKELERYFPEIGSFPRSKGEALPGKTFWIQPGMMDTCHQILHCSFDESTRQFYFDLKIRELMYQILENAFRHDRPGLRFSNWEIARILKAREILGQYIADKPPSIQALSRLVLLNQLKLKKGFRQYFHVGIFEWIHEKKMQRARHLVLNTDMPIKEIGRQVGYSRTSNFITAFGRRFGITPTRLRRQ